MCFLIFANTGGYSSKEVIKTIQTKNAAIAYADNCRMPSSMKKPGRQAAITHSETSAGIYNSSSVAALSKPFFTSRVDTNVKKIHHKENTMPMASAKSIHSEAPSDSFSPTPLITPKTSSPKMMIVNKPSLSNMLDDKSSRLAERVNNRCAINGGV